MHNDAQASTTSPLRRPENRCRSDAEAAPGWDTPPACVRSEAFAEDLPPVAPLWGLPTPPLRRAGAFAPALSLLLASLLSSSLPLQSSR